jgi:dTDP-4-amino-4,6-dideoxygalactose transaminase
MKLGLIPRTKTNYSLSLLLRSLFVKEKTDKYSVILRKLIADYFGVSDVLLTSSGRNSLYLILSYLPQKKVIIPAYTCKVVKEAAMMADKEVVCVDVSTNDYNMLVDTIINIADNNSIIIATHQYGLPCDIINLQKICTEKSSILIEDCAASFGTKINGIYTGLFGDFAFFSFDSSKLITIPPKGGFIIAKNENDLKAINNLQYFKLPTIKYKIKHFNGGLIYLLLENKLIYRIFHYIFMQRKNKCQLNENYNIDTTKNEYYCNGMAEWQAYIAIPQIRNIDKIMSRRKIIYKKYKDGIKFNDRLQTPPLIENSCCIKFAIQVANKREFYNECITNGVDFGFSFNYSLAGDNCLNAQKIAYNVLSVPFYYKLSDKDIDYVISVINKVNQ